MLFRLHFPGSSFGGPRMVKRLLLSRLQRRIEEAIPIKLNKIQGQYELAKTIEKNSQDALAMFKRQCKALSRGSMETLHNLGSCLGGVLLMVYTTHQQQ